MTHTSTVYPLKTYLAVVLTALAAAFAGRVQAQPQSDTTNRWKLLDLGVESGFTSDLEDPSTLFFRNSSVGYYDGRYRTTDGGQSWTPTGEPVPVPHRIVQEGGFGYSPDGHITTNGGESWSTINVKFPDQTIDNRVTDGVAYSSNYMVALYQEHTEIDGVPYPSGPKRLTYTLDGGVNWRFADSVNPFNLRLHDSSRFGKFPAPVMTDTFSIGWLQPVGMFDSTTALVVTLAYGKVNNQLQNFYYLARLDLKTGKGEFDPIPIGDKVPPVSTLPAQIEFITPDIAYGMQSRLQGPTRIFVQWRSTDGGRSWDSIHAPEWVDYSTFRFITPSLGVASNAVTADSGKTWKEWAHPFETGLFYASDSTHYHVAGPFSLHAWSTDAGHTWRRNGAGAFPRSVAAAKRKAVVARDYRSILVSGNDGDSWKDVGTGPEMPDDVSAVWRVAFPDTMRTPDRVVGIANFITYDAERYMALIESTDGGQTWSEGPRFDALSGSEPTATLDFVTVTDPETSETYTAGFIGSSLGFAASTDGGKTWEIRSSAISFREVAMLDSANGVAAAPDAIYTTSDGGRTWTKRHDLPNDVDHLLALKSFVTFTENRYRALFPTGASDYMDYTVLTSTNGGAAWTPLVRTGAPRPIDAGAHWTGFDSLFAVGKGATIQYTENGGQSFMLLRDSSAAFEANGGWVVSGMDISYLYIMGVGNVGARWFIRPQTLAAPGTPVFAGSARLLTNPVIGDRAAVQLTLPRATGLTIDLVDMLGSVRRALPVEYREAGTSLETIDLGGLASGRYLLRIGTDHGSTAIPLVIVH